MESQSMDDSLCILYEKIAPPPEVEIVNEIERTPSEENVPQEVEIYLEIDQESSQTALGVSEANEEDDSIHILQENKPRQVTTSSQNAGNVAVSSREPSQTASGVSQANEDDDSIHILQENKPRQVTASSQNAGNVAVSSRNQKRTKIECGICFDSLNMILDSNRNLGSTICGHLFCNTCMEASKKNSNYCPACRKRLGKNQFHPLYF